MVSRVFSDTPSQLYKILKSTPGKNDVFTSLFSENISAF